MYLISHRGNVHGPNPERENEPSYIQEALDAGYDVEVDVWVVDDEFWLGHDEPQYLIPVEFLINEKLWCHAKNLDALSKLVSIPSIHYFWHQEDDFTLTSRWYIWTYPGKKLTNRSICVLTNDKKHAILKVECAGVCSDYIGNYKNTNEKDLF